MASWSGLGQLYSDEHVIVVGVDDSPASGWAFEWAADEAVRRDALVRLVHATPHGHHVLGHRGPTRDDGVLTGAVDVATARQPAVMLRASRVDEPAGEALMEASELADLLVVGARRGGVLGDLHLGSVSEHCLRHATCPVVVVSQPVPSRGPDDRRVLVVGIDGSAGATAALDWALEEAGHRHAEVLALHGGQYPPVGARLMGPRGWGGLGAAEVLEAAADRAAARYPEVRLRVEDRSGSPAEVLLHAASSAELLVLGGRCPDELRGHLIAPVVHQCARWSACPVVVVRPVADSTRRRPAAVGALPVG